MAIYWFCHTCLKDIEGIVLGPLQQCLECQNKEIPSRE